ncbi:hypothetical protein [Clostridium sp. 'White wine YQ']|uniref:hypothetical protein n=1 Tax=Clostridium sp. 'White wine YQ' TaxID=3027474 RepID=UPI002367275A|nr:hypothetical protein [Clostridium sp. 'White wine YQ']MDD7794824.1 hypothetical protein [Clostridium sp. 'White wine YQ']
MERNNVKKNIIIGVAIIVTIAICLTLIYFLKYKNKKVETVSKLYLYKENNNNNNEIYTLDKENKETKIDEGSAQIIYDEKLKKYIGINYNGELYLIDEKGEKENIDSNADINYLKSRDGAIYYLSKDGLLMVKEADKKPAIVSEDKVSSFYLQGEDLIYYYDDKRILHVLKDNKEIFKTEKAASFCKFNYESNFFIYSMNSTIYYVDLNEKDIKPNVLEDVPTNILLDEFIKDKDFIYNTVDAKSSRLNLYVKKYDEKPELLADRVTFDCISSDKKGVYYINDIKALYYKGFDDKESIKIMDNIVYLKAIDKNTILTKSVDGKLSTVKNNKEITELGELIDEYGGYDVYLDSVAMIKSKNRELYIGNKSIADNVKSFKINGSDLCYITEDNEIYLIKNGKKPELVIKDAKKYNKILLNDEIIFTNVFDMSDLEGYWIGDNNSSFAAHFTLESYEYLTGYRGKTFFNVKKLIRENNKSIRLQISEDDPLDSIGVKKLDDEKIDIGGIILKKSDKESYERFMELTDKQLEKFLPMANSYFNSQANFNQAITEKGMVYFEYTDKNNPSKLIYIDESGKVFKDSPSGKEVSVNEKNNSGNSQDSNNSGQSKYSDISSDELKKLNDKANEELMGAAYLEEEINYKGKKYYKFVSTSNKNANIYIDKDGKCYNDGGSIEKYGLLPIKN